MEAGGVRLEVYSEAFGWDPWLYRQGKHVTGEEEDVGVSQKIINSSQAKEKFKGHFLFQISNMRVFQMRGIKL